MDEFEDSAELMREYFKNQQSSINNQQSKFNVRDVYQQMIWNLSTKF
jgi:hypothetical protein